MNQKSYRDILDSAAAGSLSQNADLWPNISARLERKSPMMTLRTRPAVAILIAFLVLLALSGVAYALGRAFGYIPGIGVVELNTPLRILAEPVTVQKQGISVTVLKIVADSTRTFISLGVDGIPLGENGTPACATLPEMHLPDGTSLEDFELPLRLVPAPAGFATPAAELAVTADGVKNKTGLHLEQVLELADSYILIGKFTDAGDLPGPLSISTDSDAEYLPRIEDANGNPVAFKVRQDIRPEPEWDVAYYWAYEIPKPVAAPLKITVDRINIRKHNTAQIQFDAGDHPQVGQEWNLNQSVKLGESEFVVDSVTFLGNGYTFNLSSESLPNGVAPDISIADNSLSLYQFDIIDSMVNNGGSTAIITLTLTTKSLPPTGKLTVNWGLDEYIPQPGPWSLVWTPSKINQ
jgi:hypothetical protein